MGTLGAMLVRLAPGSDFGILHWGAGDGDGGDDDGEACETECLDHAAHRSRLERSLSLQIHHHLRHYRVSRSPTHHRLYGLERIHNRIY